MKLVQLKSSTFTRLALFHFHLWNVFFLVRVFETQSGWQMVATCEIVVGRKMFAFLGFKVPFCFRLCLRVWCVQEHAKWAFLNAPLANGVHTTPSLPDTSACTHSWKSLGVKCQSKTNLGNL